MNPSSNPLLSEIAKMREHLHREQEGRTHAEHEVLRLREALASLPWESADGPDANCHSSACDAGCHTSYCHAMSEWARKYRADLEPTA